MLPRSYRNPNAREELYALTAQQRQILSDLGDRGPGLLVELAVRQLLLPEQISAPLGELRERGLVYAQPFPGGPLGDELFFLTQVGRQTVSLLRVRPTVTRATHPHTH